jgi:hypothetical protein
VTRPSKSPHVAELWGVSATTFLTLCVELGPHRAVFLIAVAFLVWGVVALCRRSHRCRSRFPVVGAFMVLVVCNLVSGGRWR